MTTNLHDLAIQIKKLVEIEKKDFFDVVEEVDGIEYEYQNENHNFQTGMCDINVIMYGVLIHLGRDYFA